MHSAVWWRQAGKRVKELTVVPERRLRHGKNEARRTAEDKRGGEGAHYVSVISRIRRVFSICSKAPLVRRPDLVAWAQAPLLPKKSSGKKKRGEKREGRDERT